MNNSILRAVNSNITQRTAMVKDLDNGNFIYRSRRGEVVEVKPDGWAVCTHSKSMWYDTPGVPIQQFFDRLPHGRIIAKLERQRKAALKAERAKEIANGWYPTGKTGLTVHTTDGLNLYRMTHSQYLNEITGAEQWRWVRETVEYKTNGLSMEDVEQLLDMYHNQVDQKIAGAVLPYSVFVQLQDGEPIVGTGRTVTFVPLAEKLGLVD